MDVVPKIFPNLNVIGHLPVPAVWGSCLPRLAIFSYYFGIYEIYKYVYIIRKVFLQCFFSYLLHKIHTEMAEKSQVKYWGFYIDRCSWKMTEFFHILFLNLGLFNSLIIQNGG